MKKQKRESFIYPKKIGIWAMEPGCGATYIAIAMATFFSTVCHCETAYVEMGSIGQIKSLTRRSSQDKACFCYHGVWMHPSVSPRALPTLAEQEFDTWLYDGGSSLRRDSCNQLLDARKFLVCPGSPWKWERVRFWLERRSEEELRAYEFLLPSGSYEVKSVLEATCKAQLYEVPYIKDPFELTPVAVQFFNRLFCKKEV